MSSTAEWNHGHIGDCVSRVIGGGTPSRSVASYWHGDIPWASVKDFTDESLDLAMTAEHISERGLNSSAAHLIEPGVPIICTRMAVGRIAIPSIPVAINQDLKALHPTDNVEARFLLHAINHARPAIEARSIGSTVRGIGIGDLCAVPLSWPREQAVQAKIAAILDTIADAIHSTEAVIAKLEHVKRGLLHNLLTRGIDDNGEIRDPEREPAEFKGSAIGHIPITWTTGSVLDVPPLDRQPILTGPFGAQLGARDFRPRGVPVLRIGNVQWGYVDHNELQFVSEAKALSLSRFRVRAGDLLFARQGATTGRNALADEECEGCLINYHIIRVAVDHERCRPVFLHAFINSASVSAQVERDKGRGTREGVNSRDIASLCIALPPVTEQDRIVSAIEAFEERLNLERTVAGKLAILRKGLADDLLSGRVRVQAEHQL
jgi:type I restriction enzyme S subunit